MKNPNGYGSIVKLGGKRRKPFAARVTRSWEIDEKTGKVKQIYDYIGYFKSRPEAMIALAEYNKDPYDIDKKKITFGELFELWVSEKFPTIDKDSDRQNKNAYTMAYNHSHDLHHLKFIDVRKVHMQEAINECEKGYSTKSKMKVLYTQLYKFAMENDLVDKDYSQFVTVPENEKETSRKPFSAKEIELLWKNLDKDTVDTVLIMIYTGLRPGELVLIENENINLEERYMRGGIKTKAGKNRVIPLNKKILPLIEKRMDPNQKYLMVNSKGGKMSYPTFRKDRFAPLMKELKLKHKAHDCRHTFATLMDNAGANKLSIKRIMGHASQDITDQVYTHKDIEELIKAIDLI
jgi:integrase